MSSTSILKLPLENLSILPNSNNLSAVILTRMASRNIQINHTNNYNFWNFSGTGKPLYPLIHQYIINNKPNANRIIKSLINRNLMTYNIMFISQITDHIGKNLLSWQHIKDLHQLSLRGKMPWWYKILKQMVTEKRQDNLLKEQFQEKKELILLQYRSKPIFPDKRKKEWCFVKKDKSICGKITSKLSELDTITIEH
jgi:hypothetical protein